MQEIKQVTGTAVPLVLDDIDTDRIIPARFLRCVSFEGLGEHAFEDDRQQDPSHPFNQPQFAGGSILLAGRNFGCGSSREHAPQSLMRWGIQAVVAESYAEIFFGNCTSLGVPAVTAGREEIEALAQRVDADPSLNVTVDLETLQVTAGDMQFDVSLPPSARDALTSGQWDFLGQLLANEDSIRTTGQKIPYMNQFA